MSKSGDFILFLQEHYPDYMETGIPEGAHSKYYSRELRKAVDDVPIAKTRYNDGAGALLCSSCNITIATGWGHYRYVEHFCNECKGEK